MILGKLLFVSLMAFAATVMSQSCCSQALPATAGETLSGKRTVLADVARGHATVLVAGFSREGGSGCGAWVKAIHADSALGSVTVYQIAMLEGAPGLVRGMIKSGMRKGVAPAEQDHFVVLTQDDKLWRSYFDVTADQEPYVALMDASGKVLWHGHGAPDKLEPQLKAALK